MEIGNMLGDSVEYAKEAIWGKWVKWILLVICTIIFPLMLGYMMEIYRGKKPAPELEHWGKMFIDGLKFIVAGIIYAIPIIIVAVLVIGAPIFAMMTNPSPDVVVGLFGAMAIGIIILIILAFIIGLIWYMGLIRMARTDRFGEAFNISAIMAKIRSIGWANYIIALIVIWVVMIIISFIVMIISAIPIIGWLIYLFLLPVITIFYSRYLTLIYESGGEPAPVPPEPPAPVPPEEPAPVPPEEPATVPSEEPPAAPVE